MKTFTLETGVDENGNATSPVTFEGEKIAEVSSRRQRDYRWTEIHGYRTKSGTIVVQTIGRSEKEGETDYFAVRIFPNERKMMKSMGYTKLNSLFWFKMGVKEILIN